MWLRMTIDSPEVGDGGRLSFLRKAPVWVWCLVVVPPASFTVCLGVFGIEQLVASDDSSDAEGVALWYISLLSVPLAFAASFALAKTQNRKTMAAALYGLCSGGLATAYAVLVAVIWVVNFCTTDEYPGAGCI